MIYEYPLLSVLQDSDNRSTAAGELIMDDQCMMSSPGGLLTLCVQRISCPIDVRLSLEATGLSLKIGGIGGREKLKHTDSISSFILLRAIAALKMDLGEQN